MLYQSFDTIYSTLKEEIKEESAWGSDNIVEFIDDVLSVRNEGRYKEATTAVTTALSNYFTRVLT